MILFLTFGVMGLMFIILGIYLHTGRGSFLLAGYNTMSESENQNTMQKPYANLWVKWL